MHTYILREEVVDMHVLTCASQKYIEKNTIFSLSDSLLYLFPILNTLISLLHR